MARSKRSHPEFFRLIARIEAVRTMYLFAESDRRVRDDNLLVRLNCRIEYIDKKYVAHKSTKLFATETGHRSCAGGAGCSRAPGACRAVGQHRSTQRKLPTPRADEKPLTAAIIKLA